MSIVFLGTTGYSVRMLETLVEAGYPITLVITLPDRPGKRGKKLVPTPVKEFAIERSIPYYEAGDMKSPDFADKVRSVEAELGVVVAFKILPKEVYDAPRLGTINVHPSDLPELRGPAPIRWAIIRGYEQTGVTTFRLVDKPDAGNILLQKRIEIGQDETWGELFQRIEKISGDLLLKTIDGVFAGEIEPKKQDETKATKAPKIDTEIRHIEWERTAKEVHDVIRGLSPTPGALCDYAGHKLKLLRSKVGVGDGKPGEVIISNPEDGLVISCGSGAVVILKLQPPGKRAMDAKSYLLGNEIPVGTILK